MSNNEIIRAWKDEDYLDSLSNEQQSILPENPVGIVELADEEMAVVTGGFFHCGKFDFKSLFDVDINVVVNIFNNGSGDIIFSQNNGVGSICNL